MYWDDWGHFPKAAPRPKPKVGKTRKKFGITWWGKKWVDILSVHEHDQRMSRGRAYARADMVKNFNIENGFISAKVKGSSGSYRVTIKFDMFNEKEWGRICQKLKCTPILMSKLLNNEMPEDIEDATGYCFVPDSFYAECNCPDYANPCKHIAAVFYTVADEIDHNPMTMFRLKGMDKDKLYAALCLVDESAGGETEEAAETQKGLSKTAGNKKGRNKVKRKSQRKKRKPKTAKQVRKKK